MSVRRITIWGRLSAFNVLKVVWAAKEAGVDFDRIDAGRAFGVVDSGDYRKLNPNGLVPTLEDNGFVLWESNAIVRYLCARYGEPDLYPADLRRRMSAERWMDWHSGHVFPAYRTAFNYYGRGLVNLFNEADADKSFHTANALLHILDDHLSENAFVAGERFSMGDIPIGLLTHQWLQLTRPLPSFPHLRRWRERIAAREAAADVLAAAMSLPPGVSPDKERV
jgi:glutathione S-transferase